MDFARAGFLAREHPWTEYTELPGAWRPAARATLQENNSRQRKSHQIRRRAPGAKVPSRKIRVVRCRFREPSPAELISRDSLRAAERPISRRHRTLYVWRPAHRASCNTPREYRAWGAGP